MRFPLRTKNTLLFATTFLFFLIVPAGAQVSEVENGLFVVRGAVGDNCAKTCYRFGMQCSYNSLKEGNRWFRNVRIADTVAGTGSTCKVVNSVERDGRPFPVIDQRNYCYGVVGGRDNYDCEAVSTMDSGGRRLCSCYPNGNNPVVNPPPPNPPPPANPPPPPPTNPPPSPGGRVPPGYDRVWRDNFNGNDINPNNWSRGLVNDRNNDDRVIWNPDEGGTGLLNRKYAGYILDSATTVRDGKLMLANREHNVRIQGTSPRGNFRYSSGWVNSMGKRCFNGSKNGIYLEVKAKFPEGQKVWPAIWLVASREIWPPEIDIWEYFGNFFNVNNRDDVMHLRNIWGRTWNKRTHNIELKGFHEAYDGFQTLGWQWTRNEMKWWINGELVGQKRRGREVPDGGWPEEDMCLVLNNGLMSEVGAGNTKFPNYLEIDYLDFFQAGVTRSAAVATDDPLSHSMYSPELDLVMVLGKAGESCSAACSRIGRFCSTDSLRRGDKYATRAQMKETSEALGASCEGGVHDNFDWDINPLITTENYCYPVPGRTRTNQDCDATSQMQKGGRRIGQRVCSCGTNGFWE
mmetsp:Transcript_21867/g.32539  ORF Transcript_21867/g.32539 Transcript_21867/m.32539 type:complete len:574 (-) Transcript_21867:164-1885(-)